MLVVPRRDGFEAGGARAQQPENANCRLVSYTARSVSAVQGRLRDKDLLDGRSGEDHSCYNHDQTLRGCCEDFYYGCSDPDAFNYDEDANIDLDPPDTLCENPCDNHDDLEDNGYTWYYNRGAFASS